MRKQIKCNNTEKQGSKTKMCLTFCQALSSTTTFVLSSSTTVECAFPIESTASINQRRAALTLSPHSSFLTAQTESRSGEHRSGWRRSKKRGGKCKEQEKP